MLTRGRQRDLWLFLAVTSFHVLQFGGRAAAVGPADLDVERVQNAQDFSDKVEKYNGLLREKRFDEAIVLAKQARLLQPENPLGELMVLKAKYAKQEEFNKKSPVKLVIEYEEIFAADSSDDFDEPELDGNLLQPPRRATIPDGTLEQMVFGRGLTAADGQTLLETRLEQRIESVDQICQLTDPQKRKLRLAGRGDIQRFSDRVALLQPKFHQGHVLNDNDDREVLVWAKTLSQETAMLRGILNSGLFQNGSLFAKTLKRSLTVKQAIVSDAASSGLPATRD